MKRYKSSGNSKFVRHGIKGHTVRTLHSYRGGVRR